MKNKILILGQAEATPEKMAAYLLSVNSAPQIRMDVKEFCQLYIDVAAKEGSVGMPSLRSPVWRQEILHSGGP